MKRISTEGLITQELKSYLDGVLSCFDFDNDSLEHYVTGRALELLKKLPEEERSYAIDKALAEPDYGCVNSFPYNQKESEFFLPPTEFEIDITNIVLENPNDFYIKEDSGRKLAYYAVSYGAFVALDIDRLEEHINDYLTDAAG